MNDAAPLRAIETAYRGFHFRSRTEARYAVFFDAAGIDWQYEVEGFHLDGARYLPDFFLPELKTYIEVKPTKEAAERSGALLEALGKASGCRTLFAVGSPTVELPVIFFRPYLGWQTKAYHLDPVRLRQCPFCSRLGFDRYERCDCPGEGVVLQWPSDPRPSRVAHALGEAQRARFEFGETGQPRPFTPPQPTRKLGVYTAGAIFRVISQEEEGNRHFAEGYGHVIDTFNDLLDADSILEPWRGDIFECDLQDLNEAAVGRFAYAGATISWEHGCAVEGLACGCLDEVADADVLFAWVDRKETVGTLAEVGAAYAARKPIFVAFADQHLSEHFYFIKQLATVAVVTPDVLAAWDLFERWQANT